MPRRLHTRLVEVAVRCYPPMWRDRHGDEATELAELLIRDGVSAAFVAFSYLKGAAREQLVMRPSRRLVSAGASLLAAVAVVAVPLVLSSTPANASGTEVIAVISSRNEAAAQLESVFRSHHFNIHVVEEASSPARFGSILAIKASNEGTGERGVLHGIPGPCVDGTSGCIDAIAVPLHYTGNAQVFV